MNGSINWLGLVGLSVRRPSEVAAIVLGWNLPRNVLWSAMALVCTVNATLMYLTHVVTPPLPANIGEQAFQVPQWLFSPLIAFIFVAGGLVIMVHVLHWLSSALGAPGTLSDMLAMLTWLQALRAVEQFILLILLGLAPGLAGLFALFVMVASLWLLVVFVNEAAGFQSVGKTIGVLLTATVGIIIGLSFILTLTGVAAGLGIEQNV